jgi:deazaflavin-dependent oxidoreductase (nitroreductase family)
MSGPDVGEQLAGWGVAAIVESRGRVTGRPARAALGYLESTEGSLLVAAGSPSADWARNLEADPACLVTIAERTAPYRAEVVDGPERNRVIAELILRYGTPAEGLGRGLVFRLRPVGSSVA